MTRAEGVTSRHGLSFGAHYDPDRTAFGALVAHNEDELAAGVAYGEHSHRDVEILTWVLDGAIVHRGPDGREDVVGPGTLQHLTAGTGWRHDERAHAAGPAHLLQVWIAPAPDDPPPGAPSLRHLSVDLDRGPVTVPAHRAGARVVLARLAAGEVWAVPPGSWRHVHVARGSTSEADEGDSLEVTGDGTLTVTAGPDGAEVLVVTTD